MRFVFSFALAMFACASALANDGYSQIGVGGLVLSNTNDISMDKEDLYVSAREVRVDYVMTNTTSKDIEVNVMFPLPDIEIAEHFDSARGTVDMARDLKFETKVDGKPFPIELVQRAYLGEKDISDVVVKAGIPVSGAMENFEAHVQNMDAQVRQNLFNIGAFAKALDDAGKEIPYTSDQYVAPQWTVKSFVTRKQIFPAGQSLNVSHRYTPLAGGAVEGSINWTKAALAEYDAEGLANVKAEQAKYCVDADWMNAYLARVKKRKGSLGSPQWISYILSSGATWQGPIKDFRLVVDKGQKDALVSFCGEGVKKIAPTQFEMRKKDFEPRQDLHVLILNWNQQ